MTALEAGALLGLEHAGWTSLCESRGGAFYGGLMLPGALMVLVNGMVLEHATIAATLDDAPPWASYEISEPRVVEVGSDSAALLYHAQAHRDGESEPFTALMASTYRLVDGRPRLALYQQTTITH